MERAADRCEACGRFADVYPPEMDHFFGGSLRRVMERPETCWALCRRCHRAKTGNEPSRRHWLERFISHCVRHGYEVEAELARGKLEALCLRK